MRGFALCASILVVDARRPHSGGSIYSPNKYEKEKKYLLLLFELLALIETKLKGNIEVCCGVNGIIAGVQEVERARECGARPVE